MVHRVDTGLEGVLEFFDHFGWSTETQKGYNLVEGENIPKV